MPQLLIARMTSASPNAMNLSTSCRTIGHSSNHTCKTSLVCPRPRPRAATRRRSPTKARPARMPRRSGRFRRLGRAAGSGRASASQPLRPRDRSGVTPSHRLQRPTLWGIRAYRIQFARVATWRPWGAGRSRSVVCGELVTVHHLIRQPLSQGTQGCLACACRRP